MNHAQPTLRYVPSDKHKRGCAGGGPPRWFPSTDSICPDDVSLADSAQLLNGSVPGKDPSHPNAQARFAVDDRGRFFKAYSEDGGTTWHGYPVRDDLVPRQVPARVLRELRRLGKISSARYKKLLGSAR